MSGKRPRSSPSVGGATRHPCERLARAASTAYSADGQYALLRGVETLNKTAGAGRYGAEIL